MFSVCKCSLNIGLATLTTLVRRLVACTSSVFVCKCLMSSKATTVKRSSSNSLGDSKETSKMANLPLIWINNGRRGSARRTSANYATFFRNEENLGSPSIRCVLARALGFTFALLLATLFSVSAFTYSHFFCCASTQHIPFQIRFINKRIVLNACI